VKMVTAKVARGTGGAVSGCLEQSVNEVILLANIIGADPPRLALPNHMHGLVTHNRPPRCAELAKALRGL
jgi:hypothetical protein